MKRLAGASGSLMLWALPLWILTVSLASSVLKAGLVTLPTVAR